MDTGTTRRTLVSERCPFFFRFSDTAPTQLRHGGHASSEKKKKSQILTNGQIIIVDFVIYPKTKGVDSVLYRLVPSIYFVPVPKPVQKCCYIVQVQIPDVSGLFRLYRVIYRIPAEK